MLISAITHAFRQRVKYHGIALLTLGTFVILLSKGLFAQQQGALIQSVVNAYASGAVMLLALVTWSVLGQTALRDLWQEGMRLLRSLASLEGRERMLVVWFISCMVLGSWYAAATHAGAADVGVASSITALAIPEVYLLLKGGQEAS